MPLPDPGTFFRCDSGIVWAVQETSPNADGEARVLIYSMQVHEEDMGTMANRWTEAEWDQYRVEYGFTPCARPPVALRSEQD